MMEFFPRITLLGKGGDGIYDNILTNRDKQLSRPSRKFEAVS